MIINFKIFRTFVLVYLAFSFVMDEFNSSHWEIPTRAFFIFVFSIICLALGLTGSDEKK